MRKRVYIAGPLSGGNLQTNYNNAVAAEAKLVKCGHAPHVPHHSIHANELNPQPYDTWMEVDMAWLEVSDAVVRLPGLSPGGDREVAFARSRDIPVFDSTEEFLFACEDGRL